MNDNSGLPIEMARMTKYVKAAPAIKDRAASNRAIGFTGISFVIGLDAERPG